MDTWAIAEHLRAQKDPRIKYVISNGRIFSSTTSPWVWRRYTGSNPHRSHIHVSVHSSKSLYDDRRNWSLVASPWYPTLRRGDKGDYVRKMQHHLGMGIDGTFGEVTTNLLRDFQLRNGLLADAICGPDTWKRLMNTAPPDVVPPPPPPEMVPPTVDPDQPDMRPVLRKGSRGDEVKLLQRLLFATPYDGLFGANTEAAVKGFQRAVALPVDGIVGEMTWAELDKIEQVPVDHWNEDIVATVFGGKADPNKSAYEDRWITDTELGVALPARFPGERPQVVVENKITGKSVTCEIVDVGPWNTNDPYWQYAARPQAESGRDSRGRKTNLAGIDLTPAAAKAIGLDGKGTVNWSFALDADEGEDLVS